MGRKSKETLAKEAKTIELNKKRAASFFKPKPSAGSLKRKAAAIVVSDDEDASVAGPSNNAAQSLSEILLSLKITKDNKVAIPASIWKMVQEDSSIIVRQYNKASPGGSREVVKTDTHLPDSGRKDKGMNRLTPILSFMVKDFKENILLLSGQSVSIAKHVKDIAEKHQSIKVEAAKISDPALKKEKLMESALFAKHQKVCQSSFQVGIQSLVCGLVFIHLHDSI